MRTFLTRLLVAAIAIPALVFIFHRGGEWLRLLVVLLIVLGMIEARQLAAKAGARFPMAPGILLTLLVPWISAGFLNGLSWPVWMSAVIVLSGVPVVRATQIQSAAAAIAAQIVTVFWIAIGFSALLAIRSHVDSQGFRWLLLLFANLWIGDTAAYLFGVWLGREKLAPVVSPNKTFAGAVAQTVSSGMIGAAFVLAGWLEASAALVVGASLVIAIVGQLGDLFESVLKRAAGVKESSMLIPGHGGVLDRFDSTLFAAPALYAMLQLWPR